VRLIGSRLALATVVALAGGKPLTLAELTFGLGQSTSSIQRALEILRADRLVEMCGQGRKKRYSLSASDALPYVLGLALCAISFEDAVLVVARSNPIVEFLARQDSNLVIVFAKSADSIDESYAARGFEVICQRWSLRPQYMYHSDIRRDLTVAPDLRSRMAEAHILLGTLDRTFPDRSGHWVCDGAHLGRLNSSLEILSQGLLNQLKTKYRLEILAFFGSAVRTDFRPDSDVDVLVQCRSDGGEGEEELQKLERELEQLLDRDVEVVEERNLRPAIREKILSEAVRI
jgi:uncharacterized protein